MTDKAASQTVAPGLEEQGRRLKGWNPENAEQWDAGGQRVARRNLWISIPCLTLAFCVWMIWSVTAAKLPELGFGYSTSQLFWLAALPSLVGATLRVFFSFMVPIFGGRRWTAWTTGALLIPALGIGFALRDPGTPFWVMAGLACLCGFGGGNFSSSMANISFFFPKREKGRALGLNAGIGNLGVSIAQFVIPVVISIGAFGVVVGGPLTTEGGDQIWLQNAGFVWVPFVLAATLAAWFGMNDLAEAQASFRDQAAIFQRKHNWIMVVLYTGVFGSFIGYSAGFPLLSENQFPDTIAVEIAFIGPLLGALSRAMTGGLSDRFGGGRVTLVVFALMALSAVGVYLSLESPDSPLAFPAFFGLFMVLFFLTGVGNASTFQMVPVIFARERRQVLEPEGHDSESIRRVAERESAACLGFIAAIAAYGGFFIPQGYNLSMILFDSPRHALLIFAAFYVVCTGLTWWYYTRKNAEAPC